MPSKKTNTAIFMIVATIVNLVLLLFFIILGFVLVSILLDRVPSIAEAAGILTLLVFILALALSFIVYSRLVKWAAKKFSLEENLYPIFMSKKKAPKREE